MIIIETSNFWIEYFQQRLLYIYNLKTEMHRFYSPDNFLHLFLNLFINPINVLVSVILNMF